MVVIKDLLIELDRHVHCEEAAGQGLDFIGGNNADSFQHRRIIPGVIKKPNLAINLLPLRLRDSQPLANGRFAHGLVRAQGNHHIQRLGRGCDLRVQRLEQKTDRRRSGAIRHDQQHAFVTVILWLTRLG